MNSWQEKYFQRKSSWEIEDEKIELEKA